MIACDVSPVAMFFFFYPSLTHLCYSRAVIKALKEFEIFDWDHLKYKRIVIFSHDFFDM